MPEQLDAKISDKHFLSAVDILQEALRMIRHSNLDNIGALSDLRVYLNNQETVMEVKIALEVSADNSEVINGYSARGTTRSSLSQVSVLFRPLVGLQFCWEQCDRFRSASIVDTYVA